jgi:hypothetical protein
LQWRNHHFAETAACPSFLGAFYVLVVINCGLAVLPMKTGFAPARGAKKTEPKKRLNDWNYWNI